MGLGSGGICDEFKHTAGDWVVQESEEDGWEIVSSFGFATGAPIDESWRIADLIANKNDARLIAKAPELLMTVCDEYWKRRRQKGGGYKMDVASGKLRYF